MIRLEISGDSPRDVFTELLNTATTLSRGLQVGDALASRQSTPGPEAGPTTAAERERDAAAPQTMAEAEADTGAETDTDASAYRPLGKPAHGKSRRTKAEMASDDELISLAGQAGFTEDQVNGALEKAAGAGLDRDAVKAQILERISATKANISASPENREDPAAEVTRNDIMTAGAELQAVLGEDVFPERFAELLGAANVTAFMARPADERHTALMAIRQAISDAQAGVAAQTDDPFA